MMDGKDGQMGLENEPGTKEGQGEKLSLQDNASVCASIGQFMLLIDLNKEEFLTYLYSFSAFSQDSESQLEGSNWPNIEIWLCALAGQGYSSNAWTLGFRKTHKMGSLSTQVGNSVAGQSDGHQCAVRNLGFIQVLFRPVTVFGREMVQFYVLYKDHFSGCS